jgi:hypothetical protein
VRFTPPLLALTLAAAASAQEWRIELSNPTLTPASPTTDVTIIAYVPPPDLLFAAAQWSTHAAERGWDEASFQSLIPHPGQHAGQLSPEGRSVLGQEGRLLLLLGPPIPNPLPVWRGTFTITDFAQPREIAIWTETDFFEVYVDTGLPLPTVEPRTPTEAHARIRVIPAPGPIVLLAIGAAAVRRSRAR